MSKKTKTVDATLTVVPKAKLKRVRKPAPKPQEGVEMVVRAVRAIGDAGRAVGAAMEAVRPIVERMRRPR